MRTNLIILGGLIATALAVGFLVPIEQKTDIPDLANTSEDLAKEKAPVLSFQDLNGKQHSLKQYEGRPILLNFWASWCAPCIVEMPLLLNMARDHKDMVLVLMSVDADKKSLTGFFKKYNLTLSDNVIVVWDKDKSMSKDIFGTIRYPESILVNRDGFMTQKISGAIDWNNADTAQNLNDFLQ